MKKFITVAVAAALSTGVLAEERVALNIDGITTNGEQVDALTDGLLILRSAFGIEGDALYAGVLAEGVTRETIQANLAIANQPIADTSALEAQVAQLDSEIAALESSVQEYKSYSISLEGQVADLGQQISALNAEAAGHQEEIDNLYVQINNLKSERSALEAEIGYLNGVIADRDNQIDAHEITIANQDMTIENLQYQLDNVPTTTVESTLNYVFHDYEEMLVERNGVEIWKTCKWTNGEGDATACEEIGQRDVSDYTFGSGTVVSIVDFANDETNHGYNVANTAISGIVDIADTQVQLVLGQDNHMMTIDQSFGLDTPTRIREAGGIIETIEAVGYDTIQVVSNSIDVDFDFFEHPVIKGSFGYQADNGQWYSRSAFTEAKYLAGSNALYVSSMENSDVSVEECETRVYTLTDTVEWHKCGGLDTYIADSGVNLSKSIFVASESYQSFNQNGTRWAAHTVVVPGTTSTSHATPLVSMAAAKIAEAHGIENAAQLKDVLFSQYTFMENGYRTLDIEAVNNI